MNFEDSLNKLISIIKSHFKDFDFIINPKKMSTTYDLEMKILYEIREFSNDDQKILWCLCINDIYQFCKDEEDPIINRRLMIFFKLCLGTSIGKILLQNEFYKNFINKEIIKLWS